MPSIIVLPSSKYLLTFVILLKKGHYNGFGKQNHWFHKGESKCRIKEKKREMIEKE